MDSDSRCSQNRAQSELVVSQSRTPAHVSVQPRQHKFDFSNVPRYWHGGCVFKTAFFNALSTTFPSGEQFFIDSVQQFAAVVTDPKLKQEIQAFAGQEGTHSREHRRYNAMLTKQGYDVERYEARFEQDIALAKKYFSPIRCLADTCALEHFTAIMANALLTNSDWLEGAEPEMQEIWRWHAVEETEHKSVCFDAFVAVGGSSRTRRLAMIMTTLFFVKDVLWTVWQLLKQDREQWNLKVWWQGLGFLWGRTVILRKLLPEYFSYFKSGFHPWQCDNSHLIRAWESERVVS